MSNLHAVLDDARSRLEQFDRVCFAPTFADKHGRRARVTHHEDPCAAAHNCIPPRNASGSDDGSFLKSALHNSGFVRGGGHDGYTSGLAPAPPPLCPEVDEERLRKRLFLDIAAYVEHKVSPVVEANHRTAQDMLHALQEQLHVQNVKLNALMRRERERAEEHATLQDLVQVLLDKQTEVRHSVMMAQMTEEIRRTEPTLTSRHASVALAAGSPVRAAHSAPVHAAVSPVQFPLQRSKSVSSSASSGRHSPLQASSLPVSGDDAKRTIPGASREERSSSHSTVPVQSVAVPSTTLDDLVFTSLPPALQPRGQTATAPPIVVEAATPPSVSADQRRNTTPPCEGFRVRERQQTGQRRVSSPLKARKQSSFGARMESPALGSAEAPALDNLMQAAGQPAPNATGGFLQREISSGRQSESSSMYDVSQQSLVDAPPKRNVESPEARNRDSPPDPFSNVIESYQDHMAEIRSRTSTGTIATPKLAPLEGTPLGSLPVNVMSVASMDSMGHEVAQTDTMQIPMTSVVSVLSADERVDTYLRRQAEARMGPGMNIVVQEASPKESLLGPTRLTRVDSDVLSHDGILGADGPGGPNTLRARRLRSGSNLPVALGQLAGLPSMSFSGVSSCVEDNELLDNKDLVSSLSSGSVMDDDPASI